jgi:hypothetical protein
LGGSATVSQPSAADAKADGGRDLTRSPIGTPAFSKIACDNIKIQFIASGRRRRRPRGADAEAFALDLD